jgi:class 3 adenylate cyclase
MIPGAKLVELAGKEPVPFLGDIDEVVRSVERFIAGVRNEETEFDRFLASVLFTDVVSSTERAAELGDRSWKAFIERHHAIVRAMLTRYRGTEIDTAGDGFFSTFDGPARAARCAEQIIVALEPTGLRIRAGVHTGEVQTIDGKVGGLGVVIGARIGALADPSEILVSQTVRACRRVWFDVRERGRARTEGRPRPLAAVPGGERTGVESRAFPLSFIGSNCTRAPAREASRSGLIRRRYVPNMTRPGESLSRLERRTARLRLLPWTQEYQHEWARILADPWSSASSRMECHTRTRKP